MTTGELRSRYLRLRQQSRETGQVRLPLPAVTLGAETAIHALLAAVLAGASLPGDCAPFGAALVGAAGAGLWGGGALVGACFGYLTLLEFTGGLRRASAAILIFAVNFAFYDLKLFSRPWAVPLTAGAMSAFSGAIVTAQLGWTPARWGSLLLETGLTVAAVWAYRGALAPLRGDKEDRLSTPGHRAGLLFLAATLLMALAPAGWGAVSPARCVAGLAALTVGWQGGSALGGAVGAALGGAVELAGGGDAPGAIVCALSGLTAGLFRGKGRTGVVLVCPLVWAMTALWAGAEPVSRAILGEGLMGAAVFALLPGRFLRRVGVWLAPEFTGPADLRAQRNARQRLESTARAFRTLGESVRESLRPPGNDNDVSSVFERAANRVCRNCPARNRCWQEGYSATFNALNDATPAMVERGRGLPEDYPRHFADRCLRFPAFLEGVNGEYVALLYRRQYNARVRECRGAVGRQYDQLADLLGQAAAELSRELVPDPVGDRHLRRRVAELGLEVRTAVFRDGRGLLRIEAEGPGCAALTRPSALNALSLLLGVPLRVEQEGEGCLSLLQQEPLMAVAGIAARRKNGETVSGDAGTYFKRPDGKLYVLLCDGMGSGPAAHRESSLAVRLLEQFLQAGVEPHQALRTLSSALSLRGEDAGGFTTVDLLQVDLFTGEGELFKLGAAPTYVRRGTEVERLTGASLPAGVGEEVPMDRFALKLAPGDTVLMVSDGVCAPGEDGWLCRKLEGFDGASPKDLARELITGAPRDSTDDRTALVIRIERRM